MTPAKLLTAALCGLSLVACQADPKGGAATQTSPVSGLPLTQLEIRSSAKVHRFTVEVARTEEEQAQGLMERERLGPNEGMLFPFSPPRPASFWMKNTLIPLDMIFIREDGSIALIAAMTTPHSLEPVSVGEPVAAVLEIAGGRAAELGIDESARVSWSGGPRP